MASITYKNDYGHYLMAISSKIVRVIEFASRLCYDANEKMTETSWEKYIGARVKSGHESVIEHGLITVVIDYYNEWGDSADIESLIANSNSLLHYVYDRGWNPKSMNTEQVIISGNLKMWRDFFKYYFNMHLHYRSVNTIFNMFMIFDDHAHGIFTRDIPKANMSSNVIKYLFNEGDLHISLGKDWDKTELLKKENMDLIYRQNNINDVFVDLINGDVYNENHDYGVEYWCASCDNFARELALTNEHNVPNYLIAFLNKYTLDINSISLFIKMPRIITQQESRHRINSISQRSQRYVDESVSDMSYYTPTTVDKNQVFKVEKGDVTLDVTYGEMNEWIMAFYKALRTADIPKEDARFILNNGVYSLMMVTKPFHTLPHYFKERCSNAAQKEIREPAIALRNYLNDKFAYTVANNNKVF